MRTEGHVKSWNQERGFGFIEPVLGGQEIFVHVTALRGRAKAPPIGQYVSFEIEKNHQGKKRAVDVEVIRAVRPRSRQGARATAATCSGSTRMPASWVAKAAT